VGKRGQGEGSIYKENRTGKYRGAIMVNGRRKYFSGKSRKSVAAQIDQYKLAQRAGLVAGGDEQTVAKYVEWWLEYACKPAVQETTYMCYRRQLRKVVLPELGRYKLKDLRADHVERAMKLWQDRDEYHPKSVRNYTVTLSTALNEAVRRGWLLRNPIHLATLPRTPDPEIQYYSEEEAQAIMERSKGERLNALWVVLLNTGMRIGEALALTWADVDFGRRQLHIRYGLKPSLEGGLVRGEPKSNSSRRTLLMTEIVAHALRKQEAIIAAEHGEAVAAERDWDDRDFVFPGFHKNGRPMSHVTIHRHLERLCNRIGIPKHRVHALRHTCATLLLQKGANIKQISEMLGHKDISITLRIYSHVTERMHRQAIRLMNEMFSPSLIDESDEVVPREGLA
jgi:integrase